jgi:hypothetical protein
MTNNEKSLARVCNFQFQEALLKLKKTFSNINHKELEIQGKNWFEAYYNILKDEKIFSDLLSRLGVYGGAIGFANNIHEDFVHLQTSQDPPLQGIPMIDIPYSKCRKKANVKSDKYRYEELIDFLYIMQRKIHPLRGKKGSSGEKVFAPEFYWNLPPNSHDETFKSCYFEWKVREQTESLYCTHGEITFFIYAWRLLVRYYQKTGNLDEKFETNVICLKNIGDGDNNWWSNDFWDSEFDKSSVEFAWIDALGNLNKEIGDPVYVGKKEFKEKVLDQWDTWKYVLDSEPGLIKHDTDSPTLADSLLNDRLNSINIHPYLADWMRIGILSDKQVPGDVVVISETLMALIRYARYIGGVFDTIPSHGKFKIPSAFDELEVAQEVAWKDVESLDCTLQRIVLEILTRNPAERRSKVYNEYIRRKNEGNKLFGRLHHISRFPILPYFYWTSVDRMPKAHLIFPVWKSKSFPVRIGIPDEKGDALKPDPETPVVGVGLCTVRPFKGIDWSMERTCLPLPSCDRNIKGCTIYDNVNSKNIRFAGDGVQRDEEDDFTIELPRRLEFITEFFEQLSRPLVDQIFVNRLVMEQVRQTTMKYGKKAAVASIMGRNMSHNIGSHVLSSIDFRTCNNPDQLTEFHSYLQKRMDLLARITGAKPDWGEPMYFVADLLKGFFNQTILLNHIVHDQGGWKEHEIKFKVTLSDSSVIEFTWNDSVNSWTTSDAYKDFLASIPDGNIGAQAFYIFMESMMRNSAKYGKKPEDGEPFTISIKAEEGRDTCYKLTIWDNLSVCTSDLLIKIQSAIKEKLINENTGDLETSSLGIAEMREACSFLIHPYGKDCAAREIDGTKLPLWAAKKNDATANGTNGDYLSYTFNITKPRMVAIVGKDDIELPPDAGNNGIKLIERDELLTNKGAFQFVVIYVNNEETECIEEFITKNHRKLPQRLILAVDNDECANYIVPVRRAVVCKAADLPEPNSVNTSEQFILKVYETWITKRWHYNLDNKNIKLIIAFERGGEDAIWKKWRFIRETQIFKDKANLYVKRIFGDNGITAQVAEISADGSGSQPLERKKGTNPNGNGSYTIYYDNHGTSSNGIGDFIHNVGSNEAGVDNKKIYETLSFPPQNQFGFDYFLLGLIEAGLTKVVVIDERVAEAAIALIGKDKRRHLNDLNNALCYPLFSMCNKSSTATLLTSALENHYKKRGNTKVMLEHNAYANQSPFTIKSDLQKSRQPAEELDYPDLVVFHNGIVEKVFKETFGSDDDSTTVQKIEQLYTLAPSVVITSGRGKVIKDVVPDDSPFIEFSTVRENTVQTISKYHLVRSLMSTKGVVNERNCNNYNADKQ